MLNYELPDVMCSHPALRRVGAVGCVWELFQRWLFKLIGCHPKLPVDAASKRSATRFDSTPTSININKLTIPGELETGDVVLYCPPMMVKQRAGDGECCEPVWILAIPVALPLFRPFHRNVARAKLRRTNQCPLCCDCPSGVEQSRCQRRWRRFLSS